jgi:hypothetical protein
MQCQLYNISESLLCLLQVGNIGVGESANFRPDIVVRVFKSKLKALIEGLTLKNIFGKVEALINTTE